MKKTTILCPATLTLGLISSKWKAHILAHIGNCPSGMRFGELSRVVSNISRRVLTQSLNELVEDGFLTRTEYPQVPPKVVYQLTPLGQKVQPVINVLADFGYEYMKTHRTVVEKVYGPALVEEQLAALVPEA